MPQIRAFRALRFDPDKVRDMNAVVCPPYDVIGPELHQVLLGRHPANAVRLDLPEVQPGEEPDDRYRRTARTLAAWRSDGTLLKDGRAGIYVYEQIYRVPGGQQVRTQRGFFGRLRLEDLGPGSGVLPHERTLSAPKEDRYKLQRATGVNTSPVVGLFADETSASSQAMAEIVARTPDIDVVDDDGVRHRLWCVAEDGPDADLVETLIDAASRNPVTIADGHHRYETALRYRDEWRTGRPREENSPAEFVMMLFLETTGQRLTVLPTHRVVRGLGPEGVRDLLDHAAWLFDVRPVAERTELEREFASVESAVEGRGHFGLWTRDGGAILDARTGAFPTSTPDGHGALWRLDVTILQSALDRLCGIDPGSTAAGRLAYTKSAQEALDWVDERRDDADAAFLLEPTPVAGIAAVAAEGDVMPQKSTYFYPKALTGLVINPLEP